MNQDKITTHMSTVFTELKAKIYLELTEEEAGALDAICGYGDKAFMKAFLPFFKEKMGESYIRPYEAAIPSLFSKARELAGQVEQLRDARKKLTEAGFKMIIVK